MRTFLAALLAGSLVLIGGPALGDEEIEGDSAAAGKALSRCAPTLVVSRESDTRIKMVVGARGLFGAGDSDEEPDVAPSPSASPTVEESPSPSASPSPTASASASPSASASETPTPSPSVSEESVSEETSVLVQPRIAPTAFCPRFRVNLRAVNLDTGEELLNATKSRDFWVLSTKWTKYLDVPAGTTVEVSATHSGVTVSETISTPGRPGSPDNFVSTAITSDSVTLNWSPPRRDGGKPITGYELSWNGGEQVLAGTSAVIAGLAPDTKYSFVVRARNSIGVSDGTLVVVTTKPVPRVPTKPLELSVWGTSPTSVNLNWIEPADDGGEPVEGYLVSWKGGSTTVTDTSATVTGLKPATKYAFEVQARNVVGLSPAATVKSQTILNPQPRPERPGVPRNVALSKITTNSMNVDWEVPAGTASSPYEYLVQWGDGMSVQTARTSVVLIALQPATKYSVTVTALTTGGQSDPVQVSARTLIDPVPAPAPPSSVRDLRVVWTDYEQIALEWREPAYDGGNPVLKFGVSVDGGAPVQVDNAYGKGFAVFGGFEPGTRHTFSVTALNSAGASPAESISGVTVFKPVPTPLAPNPPQALIVTAVSTTSMTPIWLPPEEDPQRPDVVKYEVSWGPGTSEFVATNAAVIDGLTPGTAYEVRVRAWNTMGPSPWVSVSQATWMQPLPNPVPGAVRNLKVTGVTGSSIAIDWVEPEYSGDDVIEGYLIRVGSNEQWVSTTSALIAGLSPAREYSIFVQAVNRSKIAGPVETVTGRTSAIPPAPTPTPQPITPPAPSPSGNSDGSVNLDSRAKTVRQTSPGEWPASTILRSGKFTVIEKESGFLTNAGQEAALEVTYQSPSIKAVRIKLDPQTKTYSVQPVLKKGKVSGSLILTVEAPAITVKGVSYEPLKASQKFTVRRSVQPQT